MTNNDCGIITLQEDCSCAQCGEELSRGQDAYNDQMTGTVFCSYEHWLVYYDVDGAAAHYKRQQREEDRANEDED